jgi:hypothetical protein
VTTKPKNSAASAARRSPGVKIATIQNSGPASKYLAETEKNLDRVLPTSSSGNTTLIVDDADDLFAKRSTDKP